MPDKMIRISGRGEDGTAKAIQTDNDGYIITKKDGGILEVVRSERIVIPSGTTKTLFTVNIGGGDWRLNHSSKISEWWLTFAYPARKNDFTLALNYREWNLNFAKIDATVDLVNVMDRIDTPVWLLEGEPYNKPLSKELNVLITNHSDKDRWVGSPRLIMKTDLGGGGN